MGCVVDNKLQGLGQRVRLPPWFRVVIHGTRRPDRASHPITVDPLACRRDAGTGSFFLSVAKKQKPGGPWHHRHPSRPSQPVIATARAQEWSRRRAKAWTARAQSPSNKPNATGQREWKKQGSGQTPSKRLGRPLGLKRQRGRAPGPRWGRTPDAARTGQPVGRAQEWKHCRKVSLASTTGLYRFQWSQRARSRPLSSGWEPA